MWAARPGYRNPISAMLDASVRAVIRRALEEMWYTKVIGVAATCRLLLEKKRTDSSRSTVQLTPFSVLHSSILSSVQDVTALPARFEPLEDCLPHEE